MEKISAREIVRSVGMSDRPEYYSGRGATTSDLDGDKLYAIYQKITKELGTKQADAFVTMVKKLKTLSATNFLNSLYTLERCEWAENISFHESNIDIGPDGPGREAIAFATLAEALSGGSHTRRDDTEYIKSSFLRKVGFERGPREREREYVVERNFGRYGRFNQRDDDYER